MTPDAIRIVMAGGSPLYERDVLAPVVRALRAHPLLAPETWGLDERSRFPFEEDEVLRAARGEPSVYELQLRRSRRVKHTTMLSLGRQSSFQVEIAPATPRRDWPRLFEAGDALAAAYRPDVGWVHVFTSPPPPFESEAERVDAAIDAGVDGTNTGYGLHGPGGLGLRTYFGPRLVPLLGRDRVRSLPAVVRELDWGGVSVDLVEHPWQGEAEAVRAAWERAMAHLRSAQVLAEPTTTDDGEVEFTRGARFEFAPGSSE